MTEKFDLLAHKDGDNVAVAVREIAPNQEVQIAYLDGSPPESAPVGEFVRLGHKVALIELQAGERVVEYGEVIGRAAQRIERGAHVHTHNLKGERWA